MIIVSNHICSCTITQLHLYIYTVGTVNLSCINQTTLRSIVPPRNAVTSTIQDPLRAWKIARTLIHHFHGLYFPGTPEHRPFAPPVAEHDWSTEASHSVKYFPDLINKLNCVRGSNYENWMQTEGFEDHYLFDSADDCCEKW